MSYFKWVKGRQSGGYEKMLIFQFSVFGKGFDCYLLRYRAGDEILQHVDPVPGKKHYRLNIQLVKAISGGSLFFYHKRKWAHQHTRTVFFRSDLQSHKVTRVIKGERIVLTFGAAI